MECVGIIRQLAGFLLLAATAGLNAQTFPSSGHSGTITIPSGTGTAASAYPTSTNCTNAACISVSGLTGSFTSMSVTLNFTSANSQSLSSPAFLLQSPDGTHNLDILSFTCGADQTSFSMILEDSPGASSVIPNATHCGTLAAAYQPVAYSICPSIGGDVFPSPGPTSFNYAGDGNTYNIGGSCTLPKNTLASTFGGIPVANMNGTWKLFVADEGNNAQNTQFNWSITFNVTGSNAGTTTSLSAGSFSPSFTSSSNSSVSFTATVKSGSTSVSGGSVTLHDSTTNSDLETQTVSNGTATFNVAFSSVGTHTLIANYGGTTGFASSSSNNVTQLVTAHAAVSGNQFCYNAADSIGSGGNGSFGPASPYPVFLILGQTINGVTEPTLSGTIEKLTVTLNNLASQNTWELASALGYTANGTTPNPSTVFEFLSYGGSGTSNIGTSGLTLTFSDTGTAEVPFQLTPPCSTCLPTDNWNQIAGDNPDTIPNPAGGNFTVDKAAPTGTATFSTEFGGKGASGVWSLYLGNRIAVAGNPGSLGSWCLNFTMQATAHPTQTVLTSATNTISTGGNASIIATVSSTDGSGTPNAGTVTFVDSSTSLGAVNVVNGVAALTITNGAANGITLSQGTHHIIGSYSGTNTGTEFGVSNGSFDLRLNIPTTETGTQPYTYCNTGVINIPGFGNAQGAADVYPSNIFVTSLPGTVKAVTVSFKGWATHDQNDFQSLLVGPGGNDLEFFSPDWTCGANCPATYGPVNITFDDTGSTSLLTGLADVSGTYAPVSLNTSVTYPACPANAPDCFSTNVGPPLTTTGNNFTPTHKAATAGTSILGNANAAGVFGGTTASTYNGNGTWSLYLQDGGVNGLGRTSSVDNGWCVNFTQNLPDISLTNMPMTKSPAAFTRGQNASFTITATNLGPGPTGSPTLTITDTLPTGLTYTGFTSSDPAWNCSASAQLVTCTYSSAIAAGSGSAFTINASVGAATADTISNSATLTAGTGGDGNTANNTTSLSNIPVAGTILTINKTHTDPFKQGQTNATYSLTVKNTGANGTSSGPGATAGTISVTDAMPTAFTITSVAGTGWNCTSQTSVSCTLNSSLAVGATTNPIVVTATVSNTANTISGALVNQAILTTTDQIGTADGTCANNVTCHNDPTNITQVPTQMSANAGTTPQSAAINTAFGTPLSVTVKDAGNSPVANVNVTFTPPGSGASGSFATAAGCTASGCTISTNSSGVAAASTFTANGTTGTYNVTASSSSLTPVNFVLTNTDAPAAVTNVTSTLANGTYSVGQLIPITVTFNKAVNVTGTPQLALNSGGTASYAAGSGTSTLTFAYTVAAGQNSAHLDYTSTAALVLNGGTINNLSGVAATLTLPSPVAAGSLSANKNIVIDTTAPTVTNVSSTTANGTYGVGAAIAVTVSFSKAVTVTGTPLLALNSGGTASYAAGSGTNTLTFVYTVAAGQNSAHLDYTSTTALLLNGGTMKDPAGNVANLTLPAPGAAGSLSANTNIVINTAAPTVTNVSSTTANGTYGVGATIAITVSFSTAVTVTGTPQLALNSGGTANYAAGSGTSTLTFAYTVAAGQNSAHLDYTSTAALVLNGGTIKDTAGNAANLTLPAPGAAGSLSANTNIVVNTTTTTAPTVVSYNVIFGSNNLTYNVSANPLLRNRLPWEITGIQVVFSEPIASGDGNSLTGVTTTGFSGLGTNTLTWSISPVADAAVSTQLAGSGASALKDAAGNALGGGSGFAQAFKVLWGDVNDDGLVNSQDLAATNAATRAAYNVIYDLNGDGVVNAVDVQTAQKQIGTSLP